MEKQLKELREINGDLQQNLASVKQLHEETEQSHSKEIDKCNKEVSKTHGSRSGGYERGHFSVL